MTNQIKPIKLRLRTKLIPNIFLASIGVVTHEKGGQEKRPLNMNSKTQGGWGVN